MKKHYLHLFILTVFIILLGLVNPIYSQDSSIVYLTNRGYANDSLDNFNGKVKYYKFKEFPNLKYIKPQINKWVDNLE
jgi:hypothetical protein